MFTSLWPWLIEIKEYLRIGNKKVYYSQFGEDIFLKTFFRGRKAKGFYVDVGANHPFRCSNTYLLYKVGWRGINIEPDYISSTLLRLFRRRDINLRCGVGKEGVRTFYRASDPRQGTFVQDVALENDARGVSLMHKEQIQMRPLRDILAEHEVSEVDVLSIDTEGGDLEVLETVDWNAIKPTVILVEEHAFVLSRADSFPVFSFVVAKGYRLACQMGYTLIFQRNEQE